MHQNLTKYLRYFIIFFGITTLIYSYGARANGQLEMAVFKTPSCGCCKKWVDHMQAAGFNVAINDLANLSPVKQKLGVPAELAACHTAVIDGVFIEGHVPADTVKRFLNEKPENALGLAVPGMPPGSPGMEHPGREMPYQVIYIDKDGQAFVYEEIVPN